MKLNHLVGIALGSGVALMGGIAYGKLPAPPALTDEQKAKAAEVKEKAAETAKKEAADLNRYQDRVAARFFAEAKAMGKTAPPSTWVPPAPAPALDAAVQPSSSKSQVQIQPAVLKTQNTGGPAAAKKAGTDAKSTPAKG